MKREEIERLLPGIFQRTVLPGTPMFALLEAMEALHQPAEDALQRIDAIFDPRRTPDPFVPYLATWVDLARILPVTTELSCLRGLIGVAAELARKRGTAGGLILFLEVATGTRGFEVDEDLRTPDGARRPFHVQIRAPQTTAPHRALIERIIDSEKPVHVTYDLIFDALPASPA